MRTAGKAVAADGVPDPEKADRDALRAVLRAERERGVGVGAARKAQQVHLVAGLAVQRQELVSLARVVRKTDAEGAAEQAIDEVARANSGVVVRLLHRAVAADDEAFHTGYAAFSLRTCARVNSPAW